MWTPPHAASNYEPSTSRSAQRSGAVRGQSAPGTSIHRTCSTFHVDQDSLKEVLRFLKYESKPNTRGSMILPQSTNPPEESESGTKISAGHLPTRGSRSLRTDGEAAISRFYSCLSASLLRQRQPPAHKIRTKRPYPATGSSYRYSAIGKLV